MPTVTITLKQINIAVEKIAEKIKGGEVFALIGALGSGKTSFTKHLLKRLGLRKRVTSPTFVIFNNFLIKPGKYNKFKKQTSVFHLDLYRTKNFREIKALGITEVWGKPNTLTIIEWADKIKHNLPKKTKYIYFIHEQDIKN